jgi:hypothetical protein
MFDETVREYKIEGMARHEPIGMAGISGDADEPRELVVQLGL